MIVNIIDAVLFVGLVVILWRNFRHLNPYPYKSLGIWFALALLIDSIATAQVSQNYMLLAVFAGLLAVWLLAYAVIKRERRRLLGGLLVNIALMLTVIYIAMLGLQFSSPLMIVIYMVLALTIFALLLFGIYALIAFLFWNALQVWRRESRTLGNTLTLLLGVGLVALAMFGSLVTRLNWMPLIYLNAAIILVLLYFGFVVWAILTSSILMNLMKPRFDKDYLIVLGAGLIDGERVTPLLAGRIDAAIAFMKEQVATTGKQAVLLMSGGQGGDEKLPESVAMKNYALSVGIPTEQILTEEKSTTTWENLVFSRQIMDARNPQAKSAFVSNDYHILRAGVFARRQGLTSEGLGSRTSRYFVPNAFIREVVALVLMNKKWHLLVTIVLALLMLGWGILSTYITNHYVIK